MGVRELISKALKWRAPPKTPLEPTIFRSGLDEIHFSGADYTKLPAYQFSFRTLYEIYKASDILRIVIDTLRRELFREGFEIKERFKLKCARCGKEFSSVVSRCDSCGSTLLLRPNSEQENILKRLVSEPVNANGEYLIDVLHQLEIDLDVTDNAYLLLVKTYYYSEDGRIVGADIDELVRLSPLYVQLLMDSKGRLGYDDKGNKLYVCPSNRTLLLSSPICPDGKQAIRAGYKVSASYLSGYFATQVETMYYGVDEIIHLKRWMPALPYGHSPIYAIWQKVLTLMYQDRFMLTYFQKQRPPRGLLAIVSENAESVRKMWQELREASRRNPHDIFPILIESQKAGRNIQFIDLMRSLPELQFTEVRNEYRRTIGAVYGVLPLFSGDIPTGWNNEGTQVLVTNRAVMWAQETYNRHLFPRLLKQLGVTDWELRLKKPERKDQVAEIELLLKKVQLMEELKALGFKVEFSHEGEVKWSKEPVNEGEEDRRPPNPTGSVNEHDIEGGVRGMSGYPTLTDFLDMSGAPPNLRRKSVTKAGKEGKVPIKIRRRDGVVQTYWVRSDKVHEFEQRQREQGNEIIGVGEEESPSKPAPIKSVDESLKLFTDSLSISIDDVKEGFLGDITYEGKGFKIDYSAGSRVAYLTIEGNDYDKKEVADALEAILYKRMLRKPYLLATGGVYYFAVKVKSVDGETLVFHVPRKEFFAVARNKNSGAMLYVPKSLFKNRWIKDKLEPVRELSDEEYEYLKKVVEARFLAENRSTLFPSKDYDEYVKAMESYGKEMTRVTRELFELSDYVFRGVNIDDEFAEEILNEGLKPREDKDYMSFSLLPNVSLRFGSVVFVVPKEAIKKKKHKTATYVSLGTGNGEYDNVDRIDASYAWELEVRVGEPVSLDEVEAVILKDREDIEHSAPGFLEKVCKRVACIDVYEIYIPLDSFGLIIAPTDFVRGNKNE